MTIDMIEAISRNITFDLGNNNTGMIKVDNSTIVENDTPLAECLTDTELDELMAGIAHLIGRLRDNGCIWFRVTLGENLIPGAPAYVRIQGSEDDETGMDYAHAMVTAYNYATKELYNAHPVEASLI